MRGSYRKGGYKTTNPSFGKSVGKIKSWKTLKRTFQKRKI